MPTLNAMFKLTDKYTKTLNLMDAGNRRFGNSILGTSTKVDSFNNKLSNQSGANSFINGIKRMTAAVGGFMAIKQGTAISDDYMNTRARIDMMNDGLQTTAKLQDNIFVAAERSRGAYLDMQKAVAKIGMMAGDAFSSSQEIVDFTELIQKSFKVGGASKVEQQSGMLQLTQALSSGKLQGDELRSISENAPMITQAISKYLGVTKGELKQLGADGELTADIIKNAMFGMANDINGKFETIPMTWSDIGTSIKNHAIKSFEEVIEKSNALINTAGFQSFVTGVKGAIDILAQGFLWVVQIISFLGQAIVDNWNIIQPLLLAAAFVLIPLLIKQLWAMVPPIWSAAIGFLIAQWPILLLIAIVGILIYVLMQFGVTTDQIVGAVTGSFMMMFAIIYNGFAWCYNIVASFAEFFANIFIDPVYAVKKLFWDLALYVNEIFTSIAQQVENMLNAIPGISVDLTSGMNNTISYIEGKIADLRSDKKVVKLDRMEYKNLNDSFNKGYNWGSNAIKGMSTGGIGKPEIPGGIGAMGDMGKYMNNGALPVTNGKGGSAGSLNVSIDKEDIKYLKDIADRDYMLKYTQATLAPNVQISFGDVKETADANKLVGIIEKILREEIAVVAEGV
ncbi:hypothetical protein IO99_00635 [Clostridium sulfidigenes]|uniref:Tape measure protein N-terminal domain-containing protein n=1 Tax=Clostridium sulfidigenes TaxID=318464 RepID=A0A084JID2_9CLOT|nr:tape measure protein [Clostridium sulfidigenes]KEZ88716.1 hypothetical protein IO99_00635 [Clostridium sulfidigenes]